MKKPITYIGPTGQGVVMEQHWSKEETAEFDRAMEAGDFDAIGKLMESKLKRLTPEETDAEMQKLLNKAKGNPKKPSA